MRILIVKLSSLGDLLHALPAVHAIKAHFDAEVDWVVQSEYASLVACFSDVDRVITTQRRAFLRNISALKQELRKRDYDMVIDLQGLLKSAVVTAMAKSARKIGPPYHREGTRVFYKEIGGRLDLERHAVDQAMDVARHLGCNASAQVFPLAFPARELDAGFRHVGFLPLTRWPSKTWPIEHFVSLGRELLADEQVMIHLLGSPDDVEHCRHIADQISNPRLVNHAGEEALPELGALLAAQDLLIAGDSGPVHIAAAVGTPALVLFGPTRAERTGPFGEGHRVIRAPAPCEPCLERVCHRHGEPCLSKISPGSVAEVARNMLEA